MPMPIIDPKERKREPQGARFEPMDLEMRLELLKETNPEWFVYSDSLGERPIDGMKRMMVDHWDMRDLQHEQAVLESQAQQRQVDQNRAVAPNYTDQVQETAPPGMINRMGKVM